MPLAQSTKTVADISTAVKRQFGDESGTQITDVDIIRWINQGQNVICQRGEVNKTTITTSSVAGQDTYSMAEVNIFKLLGVQYDNVPLQNSSFEQVQESVANVGSTNFTARPELWYEWDDSIILYPTPSSSDDVIKLFIIAAPAAAATTTSALSIPDTHFDALLQYVLQQAYELDDDFSSAGVKGQQMENSMTRLASTATYNTYPTITVLDEDL